MPNDPVDSIARVAVSPEGLAIWSGMLAAGARLATYTGPPRPRSVAMLDALATIALGFIGFEAAFWWTANDHASLAAGALVGVLGWNEVKRWAWAARMRLGRE
jgi:hypothetical protein